MNQLEKKISQLKVDRFNLERKYNNLRTAHARLQIGLKVLLDVGGIQDESEAKHIDCDFD